MNGVITKTKLEWETAGEKKTKVLLSYCGKRIMLAFNVGVPSHLDWINKQNGDIGRGITDGSFCSAIGSEDGALGPKVWVSFTDRV